MVVLPLDSGPEISTTLPRGMPPTPRAASKESAPVGITSTGTRASLEPRRMMEPLPNCFSIWTRVRSMALLRSARSSGIKIRNLLGASEADVLKNCFLRANSPSIEWRLVFAGDCSFGDEQAQRYRFGSQYNAIALGFSSIFLLNGNS